MQVFIRNHGDPRPDRRPGPFRLDGWIHEIPLDGRLEIEDGMLGYMARPLGEQSAVQFGIFVTGLWNKASYDHPWITLEDADGNPIDQDGNVGTNDTPAPTTQASPSDTRADDETATDVAATEADEPTP